MGAGDGHHRIALGIFGQAVVNFVGGIAGGNEQDAIQMKTPLRRLRRRQVPGMDGVKRSAKNCDVHEKEEIGRSAQRLIGSSGDLAIWRFMIPL